MYVDKYMDLPRCGMELFDVLKLMCMENNNMPSHYSEGGNWPLL